MKEPLLHKPGESICILIWAMHSRPIAENRSNAEYKSKIKVESIKLLEMIKENSLSFNDKKKANIGIINAIINLMTTRQRDDEDLTKYTKHFKWQEISARGSVRDLDLAMHSPSLNGSKMISLWTNQKKSCDQQAGTLSNLEEA